MTPPLHVPGRSMNHRKGIIKTADSLDIGTRWIACDTFKATVARYNELAKLGEDKDFGKRAACLTTIEKSPFYAAKLAVTLLVTLGGLKVNDKLQVLDTSDKVIPGLYAAGNTSGCFFSNDYPNISLVWTRPLHYLGLSCRKTQPKSNGKR